MQCLNAKATGVEPGASKRGWGARDNGLNVH
jgi:hypothetical protein